MEINVKSLNGLTTNKLGQNFLWFDEIDSTNNYCRDESHNLPHGTVVAAGRQSAGKGTRSRSWISEQGAGLYHSFLLKGIEIDDMSLLPLLAGLAVAKALREECKVDAAIKWSNDIVVGGKKICGILCESRIGGGQSSAVVGIGVNLLGTLADFETVGLVYATSLLEVTGRRYNPLDIAPFILNRFEPIVDLYLKDGFDKGLRDEYKSLCVTLGRDVRIISSAGDEIIAKAVDIANDGALIVEVNGNRETVRSGDVSVRGIYDYV